MKCKGRKWLVENGYGGLYCADVPCGCENLDIAPCEEGPTPGCKPGYKHFDPRPDYKGYWGIFASKETPDESAWEDIGY